MSDAIAEPLATSAEEIALNVESAVGATGPAGPQPISREFPNTGMSLADHARSVVQHADVAMRQRYAELFSRRAHEFDGVREIRLTADNDEFVVTALVESRDLELDLALQRIFLETTATAEGGASLRTRIYGYDDPDEDGELV